MREIQPVPIKLDLIARIDGEGKPPVAIQALWDGDTFGWYLVLEVVYRTTDWLGWRRSQLAQICCGSDFRLFSGEVPPWPEARIGRELGEELARHYRVPFYFPSPDSPDDTCPPWWERHQAMS